ncbi:hypothetical protein V8C26DRAFT_161075 [Trichoderma gracile]
MASNALALSIHGLLSSLCLSEHTARCVYYDVCHHHEPVFFSSSIYLTCIAHLHIMSTNIQHPKHLRQRSPNSTRFAR